MSRTLAARSTADLAGLRERARPVTLAREHTLPVVPALEPLLPGGGLRRGGTVAVTTPPGRGGVSGPAGVTSLALALAGGASSAGSWVGILGLTGMGAEAAFEASVVPGRMMVVDAPPGAWATAAATLVDAVDVVVVRPPSRLRVADARRLRTRARERQAVLVVVGAMGVGGQAADVTLTVVASTWYGADAGYGHLRARRIEVVAGGRGAAARERRVALWLPGPDGRVAVAPPTADGAAGRRRDASVENGRPLRQVG